MKTGLLLAAFGTASPQGETALRLFTERVRHRFPALPVRWAFTSPAMRERLAGDARKKSDSVEKALRKMAFERFTRVAVQPLHVTPGFEFEDIQEACARLAGTLTLRVGAPLLTPEADFVALADALLAEIPPERQLGDAVLFVGHGSRHASCALLLTLGEAVRARDPLAFTATMKGPIQLEQVLPELTARRIRHVWMLPLLAVVGRHVLEDLAGTRPDAWRARLEAAGIACTPVLRGMAEYPLFGDIWTDNLARAVAALDMPDVDGK